MKKNFFKKLSFVMALAMIVSIIAPAAGAFAAEDAHLNATKKYLHLGDAVNGVYDFNIAHKQAGWKYAWTSSDEDVAQVDEANGFTTATGVGSAKISVAITDKDGADVTTLDATVVVRDNIKEITEVYMQTLNAPALDKLQAATDYDFGRKFKTVTGSTTATSSVTRWFVDSAKATISDAGVFKATEAGTYKITAVAFQSKDKYNAWLALKDTTSTVNVLASKTLEVKVVNEATVAQTNLTTVKVSFKAPVASLAAADVKVDYMVTATKTPVPQVVKKVTLADDKMSATVEMYNAFAGGSTYAVTVNGMAAKEFVAATANVADVDYFTITPATATVNTETDVVVKLFNKGNVDITTDALLAKVTLSSSSEKVLFVAGTKHLTMYNVGDATTISGTFHTYSYDTQGNEVGAKTASAVVTCVPAANVTIGSVVSYTVAAVGAPDFDKQNHSISLSDSNLHLYVKANMIGSDSTKNSNADAANFRLTSTDNTTLIINGDTLYPVKEGNAAVIVEYRATVSSDWTVIGSAAVTVSAARKATTLDLGSYAFALSNDGDVADTKAVSLTVKDQYGVGMSTANVAVEKLANATLPGDVVQGGAGNVSATATSVTFAGAGAAAGTYTYKITANTLVKYVNVTVQAPLNQTVSYYKLNVSGSSFDRKIDGDHLATSATIQVFAYASNGVANAIVNNLAVSGCAVSVKLFDPTGADKTSLLTYSASGAALTVAAQGAPATQIATGVWTLKLYNASGVLIDTATFTVTDSSPSLQVTTTKLVGASVLECFTAKYNDGDVTASLAVGDTVGAGSVIFVKTLTYTDAYGVTHSATVNTAITIQ
jgi:hypothetical protein